MSDRNGNKGVSAGFESTPQITAARFKPWLSTLRKRYIRITIGVAEVWIEGKQAILRCQQRKSQIEWMEPYLSMLPPDHIINRTVHQWCHEAKETEANH
ncbi:hypothetical protein F53441_4219 [Fusarium austroafricanum]|uniref:Uncharacterized protein n=1 Tax=Fusarium austroafricanum TaxID=2364996 RepID=A0A8H4P0W2_9HYPO|nr:hypothetical protein F53441_4219 [Fusarium austroafricanum]